MSATHHYNIVEPQPDGPPRQTTFHDSSFSGLLGQAAIHHGITVDEARANPTGFRGGNAWTDPSVCTCQWPRPSTRIEQTSDLSWLVAMADAEAK